MRLPALLPLTAFALIAACADAPSAPTPTDVPSLQTLPPPPPADGDGVLRVGDFDLLSAATASVTPSAVCPLQVELPLTGQYFSSNNGNNAFVEFRPNDALLLPPVTFASGTGRVHQVKLTNLDAMGAIVVVQGGARYEIRFLDYTGTLLPPDAPSGSIAGPLTIKVNGCPAGTTPPSSANLSFTWYEPCPPDVCVCEECVPDVTP